MNNAPINNNQVTDEIWPPPPQNQVTTQDISVKRRLSIRWIFVLVTVIPISIYDIYMVIWSHVHHFKVCATRYEWPFVIYTAILVGVTSWLLGWIVERLIWLVEQVGITMRNKRSSH
jgi:hypothetical protein